LLPRDPGWSKAWSAGSARGLNRRDLDSRISVLGVLSVLTPCNPVQTTYRRQA
jgi:hypothetical protein